MTFLYFVFLFSGEACLFAKFGGEVHYKQSKWKQVRSRHEDLPGERGCWRSGCGSKQSQPWRLHLSLPCLFEEWRTFHRNWQERHLEPPVLWHSINDMGGLCVLRVWTETRVWPQNGLIIVTAIYGNFEGEHEWTLYNNYCKLSYIAYVVFPWDKLMTNSCFQTQADVGSTPRYHVWKNRSGHYDGKGVLEAWGFSWHFIAFISFILSFHCWVYKIVSQRVDHDYIYPLVMTNSSPWYRWSIYRGLPINSMGGIFPWRTVNVITRGYLYNFTRGIENHPQTGVY